MGERRVRTITPYVVRERLVMPGAKGSPKPIFVFEKSIADFCNGCDMQTPTTCKLVGKENQGLNVGEGICVWSSKNRIRGRMTTKGFLPGRKKPTGTRANLTIVE
jgi:hypothetical protein